MEALSYSLNDLKSVAEQVIACFKDNKVILFEGEMGAGKTTLIKVICELLGVKDNVSSPTFGIVNEYLSDTEDQIYHFDFYRFDDESEALSVGVDDYFYSNNYCFIEWSSKIPSFIPEKHGVVEIQIVDELTRSLQVVCYG